MALFWRKELTYDEVKKKVDSSKEKKAFLRNVIISDYDIKKLEADNYHIIIYHNGNKTNYEITKRKRW